MPTGNRAKAAKRREPPAPAPSRRFDATWWWLAALLAALIVAFSPILSNGFTNWDDPEYVTRNALIQDLGPASIERMFRAYVLGNYHPVTLLSLALDYRFFELDPRGYHATSLVLHVLVTLLIFTWIALLGGDRASALAVAALAGLHPMRVESVAWIAARKDLLCAFFYLGSLVFYHLYTTRPRGRFAYYSAALAAFLLALLSKAMAVTLVPVLVLIDFFERRPGGRARWLDKIPFAAAALVFGLVGIDAQRASQAISDSAALPWHERLFLSAYALLVYLGKAVVPFGLSAFHRYPQKPDGVYPWYVYAAPLVVAGVAVAAWRLLRPRPLAAFGALFFVANLVLVLQLLPVGSALIAERYSYLAYPGLLLALVVPWRGAAGARGARWVVVLVVCAAAALGMLTYRRCAVWRDSGTLWSDALRRYPEGHPIVLYNLASFWVAENRNQTGALELLDRGVDWPRQVQPELQARFLNLRGRLRFNQGSYDAALEDYDRAITVSPDLGELYVNRSFAHFKKREFALALADVKRARALGAPVLETYQAQLESLAR